MRRLRGCCKSLPSFGPWMAQRKSITYVIVFITSSRAWSLRLALSAGGFKGMTALAAKNSAYRDWANCNQDSPRVSPPGSERFWHRRFRTQPDRIGKPGPRHLWRKLRASGIGLGFTIPQEPREPGFETMQRLVSPVVFCGVGHHRVEPVFVGPQALRQDTCITQRRRHATPVCRVGLGSGIADKDQALFRGRIHPAVRRGKLR